MKSLHGDKVLLCLFYKTNRLPRGSVDEKIFTMD